MKHTRSSARVWTLLTLAGALLLGACVEPPPTSGPAKRDGGVKADMRDTSGACGELNGNCCPGDDCGSNTGLKCSKQGICCGAPTSTCTSNSGCCSGLTCTTGKCCTAIAGACQTSSDCCAGLACAGGICDKPATNTGTTGKACGPGGACAAGNECKNGICTACSGSGEPCCGTGTKCKSGLICSSANICGSDCGETGKKCCTGTKQCNATSATCSPTTNLCVLGSTAGTLGNACKPNNVCDNGLQCVGGKCVQPSPCKTVGATCCAGNRCDGNLVCAENNKCVTAPTCGDIQDDCGAAGQPACCTGKQCKLTVQPVGVEDKNTCCVGEGASCPNGDLDCCGWLLCDNGTCTAQGPGGSCLQNSDCTNRNCDASTHTCGGGSSGGGGGSCAGLNASCGATQSCCASDNTVCKTLLSTGGQACCRRAFEPCSTGLDCCGAMACDPVSKQCLQQGEGDTCVDNEDCVDGTVCGDTKKCVSTSSPNLPVGGACSNANQCSGSLVCPFGNCCWVDSVNACTSKSDCCYAECDVTNGAGIGSKFCCNGPGESCGDTLACCGGYDCRPDGRCQRDIGGDCESPADCYGVFTTCVNNVCE